MNLKWVSMYSLFLENKILNNSTESIHRNQSTGKDQHNQFAQFLWTSWILEAAEIQYQKLIEEFAAVPNVAKRYWWYVI